MIDYFDRVEEALGAALKRGAHLPCYRRLPVRRGRGLVVGVACLVVAGSALAAAGVFRTGAPVKPAIPAIPTAASGSAVPTSVRLLALRVSDPNGGPPWALRELTTTRGLVCLQLGRLVGGAIGVLGQDGAFSNDGRFHRLSINYLEYSFNCSTVDAQGHGFVNEKAFAVPASALFSGDGRAAGCTPVPVPRGRLPICPAADLRDVQFGLLGPDALSITHTTPDGSLATTPTGPDGAYLIVLKHDSTPCIARRAACRSGQAGDTGGPALVSGAIRAVTYRGAPTCRLPAPATASEQARVRSALRAEFPELARPGLSGAARPSRARLMAIRRSPAYQAFLAAHRGVIGQQRACAPVGYVAPASAKITSAQVATPITVHTEAAKFYCINRENIVPCDAGPPAGYTRVKTRHGPPALLAVVNFTARLAVANNDSHYEVYITTPTPPNQPQCLVNSGTFGATTTNLRAGQRVRFTQFINPQCPGVTRVRVTFITTNGPTGAMPVPGAPGQGRDIPVGEARISVRPH